MLKSTIYVNILFVLLLSCEKEIEIDMPKHESKAVVNCLFTNDSIFKIHISKSVGVLEAPPPVIKDAEVKLYKNDEFVETLEFDKGWYKSNHIASLNDVYRIEGEFLNLKSISSVDSIPALPNLTSWEYMGVVHVGLTGMKTEMLQIKLQDDLTTKNYYEVVLEKEYTLDENYDYQHVIEKYFVGVFNDEFLNGNNSTYDCTFYNNYQVPQDYSLILILRSISKEYYTYKKNRSSHYLSEQIDSWNDITEPFQMTTNINGGFGVFAGYSEIQQTIK